MQFFTDIRSKSTVWDELLTVVWGAALLFAGSQIEIPLQPVPINLMTVAVMLIGLTYSPRRAVETLLLWLSLAAMGLPVLSGFSGGLSKFAGPTAGYLAGSVIAAFAMATLKKKYSLNSWMSDALLCLMGTLIVFTCGVTWLSQLIGFSGAILQGVLPFIIPGLVKAGLLCSGLQVLRYSRRA